MKLKIAQLEDIDNILALHSKYQINTILEDDKKDGFVTTAFTKEQLTQLITEEQGLFIAIKDERVVAYVMSASWKFWCIWPMFEQMVKDLPNIRFQGQELTVENSYQYGPVCVDKEFRGSGLLKEVFDFALENMAKKYPILITFINKINPRSYNAHVNKLGLEVIEEFTFNNNNYYELACFTSKNK